MKCAFRLVYLPISVITIYNLKTELSIEIHITSSWILFGEKYKT